MLASVTDRFGQRAQWRYAPLAGKAGRMAGMTSLLEEGVKETESEMSQLER